MISSIIRDLRSDLRNAEAGAENEVLNRVFEKTPSSMSVERIGQLRITERGEVAPRKKQPIYCATSTMVRFGAVLLPDRALPEGCDYDPRVVKPGDTMLENPYRLSDSAQAISDLVAAFRTQRELDAAHVFNTATVYDPDIGGDGEPMCSGRHPWYYGDSDRPSGTWSNRFATRSELNVVSLQAACELIANSFVDGSGLKITLQAKRLIVPEAAAAQAQETLDALDPKLPIERTPVVMPRLTDPDCWFVQTNTPGLRRFEREKLDFGIEVDGETDGIFIKGYERRVFCCIDPRGVFGNVDRRP